MKSVFRPRLVNGPFDDPVLYVRVFGERNALLFDLGDISALSPSEIMRVSDAFVTHTHIDHFVGFDHLLRIVLGRDKKIRFYGPAGIIGNVRGKLAGYTWNLVDNYRLELEVIEVDGSSMSTRLFTCRKRFRDEEDLGTVPFDGLLIDTPLYAVRAAVLDHRTPCLGFSLEEKEHINVRKEALERSGMTIGPWLSMMKKLHREGKSGETVTVPFSDGRTEEIDAGRLIGDLAVIGRGRKIAYVSDISFTGENSERVADLARGGDILYCEAAFLERDLDKARDKSHLTAAQAGRLASLAGVRRLEIFHFSPRYQDEEEILRQEAGEHFEPPDPVDQDPAR
jgi:ribonuclease Z